MNTYLRFIVSVVPLLGLATAYAAEVPTPTQEKAFPALSCFVDQNISPKVSDASDQNSELRWSYHLGILSWLNSFDTDQIESIATRMGYDSVKFIHAKKNSLAELKAQGFSREAIEGIKRQFILADTQALWLENSDHVVLSFAATDYAKMLTVMTDFFSKPQKFSSRGKIHAGFYGALKIVWKDIITLVRSTDKPIYITGHSLGGALAVLATADLLHEENSIALVKNVKPGQIRGMYTFGAPRVGDEKFSESFSNDMTEAEKSGFFGMNAVDTLDLIPSLPMWAGFVSLPLPIAYITNVGGVEFGMKGFSDVPAYNVLFRSGKLLPLNHSIEVYLDRVAYAAGLNTTACVAIAPGFTEKLADTLTNQL